MTIMIDDLPPMTRNDLLGRCAAEGEQMGRVSFAVSAIAGLLRRDAADKSEEGPEAGMTLGQLDGLAVALELIADKLYIEGDNLETMARNQRTAA